MILYFLPDLNINVIFRSKKMLCKKKAKQNKQASQSEEIEKQPSTLKERPCVVLKSSNINDKKKSQAQI